MAARLRSGLPLLRRALTAESLSSAAAEKSIASRAALIPDSTNTEYRRTYASKPPSKEQKVKLYVMFFKISLLLSFSVMNYHSSMQYYMRLEVLLWCLFDNLCKFAQARYVQFETQFSTYISGIGSCDNVWCFGKLCFGLVHCSSKANVLDKVESELHAVVEASSSKKSPLFSQFMKDLSLTADTRVKAINDICTQAKFSDITKNFLIVVAENGRLGHLEQMAQRFTELTMAHKGEVKATVDHCDCKLISNIPLPPTEEKELKETLQDVLGQGKKVKIDQKMDPNILGGIVVEFGQKVLDTSIRTRSRLMERFLRQPANFDAL
ncbi:hypothetical protein ACS0TY_020397 [Phlomoides rotata]